MDVVQWLRSVASALDIGPSATRVAVTQYSSDQDVEFGFIDNPSAIVNAFNNIRYRKGSGTHTGAGIAHGYDDVLRNARGGVRRVMVVVTDGKASDNFEEEADALRDRNIDVLAVGFAGFKTSQLEDICDCNNYITGDDVDDLLNQVEAITRQVCD
jgi:collagen type XII alpha